MRKCYAGARFLSEITVEDLHNEEIQLRNKKNTFIFIPRLMENFILVDNSSSYVCEKKPHEAEEDTYPEEENDNEPSEEDHAQSPESKSLKISISESESQKVNKIKAPYAKPIRIGSKSQGRLKKDLQQKIEKIEETNNQLNNKIKEMEHTFQEEKAKLMEENKRLKQKLQALQKSLPKKKKNISKKSFKKSKKSF